MRVIAGKYRSRPLLAPPGLDTRPTADRLRETLFNVLTQGAVNRVEGGRFLDLYAGSGAVGIEAHSRGASQVVFVEQASAALSVLKKNLAALKIAAGVSTHKSSVARFIKDHASSSFDVIFLDPPYEHADEYAATLNTLGATNASLLAPEGMVIAEHRRKEPLAGQYGALERSRILEQGDAALSFYQRP